MRIRRLSAKITMALLLVTVLTAVLIGVTSYFIFRSVLYGQAVELGMKAAQYNAEEIRGWAREKAASLERTAVHIASASEDDDRAIQRMLFEAAMADPSFFSVFLGFEDGRLMDA
jgi:hypothetical protein